MGIKRLSLLLVFALFGPAFAQGQEFQPIPPDMAPKYKLDWAKYFFANKAAERAALPAFYKLMAKLGTYKGRGSKSAKSLDEMLALSDRVNAQAARFYIYVQMLYSTNTKDTASRDDFTKVTSDLDGGTKFVQQELLKIDPKTWAAFVRQAPDLKKYEFEAQTAWRLRAHTLSLREEELLSRVRPFALNWQAELFQLANDRTNWGKIRTPKGDLDVQQDQSLIDNNEDRAIRKEGFQKEYQAYNSQRDLYAFTMSHLENASNEMAKISRYKSAPDAAYSGIWLSENAVKSLYDQLASAAKVNKQYQQLKTAYIGRTANIPDIDIWDLNVLPPDVPTPRYTIGQATQIIQNTIKPFGSEYSREMSNLLNPNNGRLDIVKGPNRVPGAFSWGFAGTQTAFFYSYAYDGYYDDVSTLIHEAGHVVNMQMMANHKVIPANIEGPPYFTEGFAIFNELLLPNYLYQHETNPKLKIWYLQKFLDEAMGLFGITRQARLEQLMYDGVGAGKLHSADDFDKVALANGKKFSIWYDKHPDELKADWIVVHHYFDQPLYYENYVYADFLAIMFFQMFEKDPTHFVPRYLDLVRHGYDAPPAQLLKKFLGVNLQDPNLVPNTVSYLKGRLSELQKLYESN